MYSRYATLLIAAVLTAFALPAQGALIDLSGGTGGQSGQTVYTAPNGTVVTSSAPVWSNSNFYYMEYMFNGSLGTSAHTDYWLGSNPSPPTTLTFDLDQTYLLDSIRVYPYSNSSRLLPSNYLIEISSDGSLWTDITGGFVDTSADAPGVFHDHFINSEADFVRFTVENITNPSVRGPSLNEIQLFGGPPPLPIPEPSTMLLLGVMLALVNGRQRRTRTV